MHLSTELLNLLVSQLCYYMYMDVGVLLCIVQRNPNVKLCGLPWSFPGWLGDSHGQPYRNVTATADYVVRWILGAQKYYNLTIDCIGVRNIISLFILKKNSEQH